MKLYEIDEAILSCIDEETGEVIDEERLTELALEREKKIENVALWYKNLMAEKEAYKKEKEYFTQKEKQAEKKAESLKSYLSFALNGQAFNTTRVKIGFRVSRSVEILDIEKIGKDFITYEPKPNKKAIKEALQEGEIIDGAVLVDKLNIQIK
jgi:hypothetical protein